MHPLDAEELRI